MTESVLEAKLADAALAVRHCEDSNWRLTKRVLPAEAKLAAIRELCNSTRCPASTAHDAVRAILDGNGAGRDVTESAPPGDSGQPTFWNGEPANCARGTGTVVSDLPAVGPWPARTKGERIRVVRVFYGGDLFDLDDDDGRAWRKVTNGHGSPRYGHRNVTLETRSLEPDSWEPLIREWAKQEGLDPDADDLDGAGRD